MPLYMYRSVFRDQRFELTTRMIIRYGDSLVTTRGSCTAVFLTQFQAPMKAMFQVTDTRGYLIIGRGTVRKLGYIHFLKNIPPRLIQQPKMHTHLKAIRTRQEVANEKDQGLRCLRLHLVDGVVLINGKRHRLPILKEYVLQGQNDVFSGVGTLPGEENHIMLEKNYVPV